MCICVDYGEENVCEVLLGCMVWGLVVWGERYVGDDREGVEKWRVR